MKQMFLKNVIAAAFCTLAASAFATPVLVSESPWQNNSDAKNMGAVFGTAGYTNYTSFGAAGAQAGSIFSAANRFVMLEGGANTDVGLASYLSTYGSIINGWVNGGGSLLIQSAGWTRDIGFNGVNLTISENSCGTLTSAGVAAFGAMGKQCGGFLAHDVITGAGLTSFMTGDNGGSIIAGMEVGKGYIMYSGLTASDFHSTGAGLTQGMIQYAANQAGEVPEPASIALLAAGLAAIGALRRRSA